MRCTPPLAGWYGHGCPGGNGRTPSIWFDGVPEIGSVWQLTGSQPPANGRDYVVFGATRPKSPFLLPCTRSCLRWHMGK